VSVINEMLRNLDERQASERERAGLPPRLRTLPPEAARRGLPWPWLMAGVGIGVLIAWLTVAFFRPTPDSSIPGQSSSLSVTPRASLAAVTEGAPAGAPGMPQESAEAAPSVARATSPPAETAAPDMRLSTSLGQARPTDAASEARPIPDKPVVSRAPPTPLQEAEVVAPKPAAPPQALPAEAGSDAAPQIDRRPRGGTAREIADAEYQKGMLALRRGENLIALSSLRRALTFDASLAAARQALLAVLVAGREWEEARAVAAAGLALDPRQSGWAVVLARLQLERGDLGSALDTLERHADHAAGNADFQGLFAYVLHQDKRFDEAAARYQAALAVHPGEGRWWFGLATALESAGKANAAREAYTRARATANLPAEMAAMAEQRLRQIPGP